jgi:hypothetical protein
LVAGQETTTVEKKLRQKGCGEEPGRKGAQKAEIQKPFEKPLLQLPS